MNMSPSIDVEKFGEKLSDDRLIEIIRAGRDEEALLGALKELARRKSSRRSNIYREILNNPEQSMSARKTVVTQLGTERLTENQELLLGHLGAKDASLFGGIVHSLGKIGDEEALKRLEEIAAPDDAAAGRALAFARSLLVYRLRLDRHLIVPPTAANLLVVTDGVPIDVTKVKAETVKEALNHVRQDVPAIPLTEEGALQLTCRSTELLLVFTEEFQQPQVLATIRDRSALPMVLLKKGYSLGHYFLELYLFTHPLKGRKAVSLLGVRPRGELVHAGQVRVPEKEFTFTLKSVDSRYAPAIEVEGRYEPDQRSFNFTKAVSSTQIAGKENKAGTPQKASPNFR